MRDWIRNIKNFGRRLKNRLADGRDVAIAGRWLALCLLIAAVAAVGVWGSAGEDGGVNGVLQAAWQEQNSALPKVVVDDLPDVGEKNNAPVADGNSDEGAENKISDGRESGEVNAADIGAAAVSEPQVAEDEVYDAAPEPWVGDAVLQAEADLLTLTPPLRDFVGVPMRTFGYGYDESFGDYRFHGGADWQAEEGDEVLASLSGEIAALTQDGVYGEGVVLKCGEKLELTYYGLHPAEDLSVGKSVNAGDRLGVVAASPLFEEGYPPHLHLEIKLDGEKVNPSEYTGGFQQG